MKVKLERTYGEIIYSGEASSIKECVENLVRDGVDLSYADLSGAVLNYAKLNRAMLNGAEILQARIEGVCRMDFGWWSICITKENTTIGCQTRENSFWLKAEPKHVRKMDRLAEARWIRYGNAVKAAIIAVMGEEAE